MEAITGLQLLRVKRRRDETVPDLLIVQQASGAAGATGAGDSQKRLRRDTVESQAAAGVGAFSSPSHNQPSMRRAASTLTAQQLSRQLSAGLALTGQHTPGLGSPQCGMGNAEAPAQEVQTTATRRRYVRVQTLHKGALQGMAPEALKQLVCSWQQAALAQVNTSSQVPFTGGSQAAAGAAQLQYKLLGCKRPLAQALHAVASSPSLHRHQQAALQTAASSSSSLSGGGGRSGLRSSSWRQGSSSPAASPARSHSQRNSFGHSQRNSLGGVADGTAIQDPLGGVCAVIDVQAQTKACSDAGAPTDTSIPAQKRLRSGARTQADAPSAPMQQAAATASPLPAGQLEALLKSTFLPMLQEYVGVPAVPSAQHTAQQEPASETRQYKQPSRRWRLTGHAVTRPQTHPSGPETPQRHPKQHSLSTSPAAAGQLPADQLSGSTAPMSTAAVQESEDEDEMVYDVYIPLPMDVTQDGVMETDQVNDWSHVPVIQVPDWEDGMLQWEQSGMAYDDGADDASEDSNAESYYANSYPDEEDEAETEDEFGSYERHGSTSRARSGRGWDEEEFDVNDYDSDEDHSVGSFDAVQASRRAAQAFLRAALERRGAQQPSNGGKAPTHAGRTAHSRLQQIM